MMIRRAPTRDAGSVSDRELGVAALLLLVAVVLTVIIVPAIG